MKRGLYYLINIGLLCINLSFVIKHNFDFDKCIFAVISSSFIFGLVVASLIQDLVNADIL